MLLLCKLRLAVTYISDISTTVKNKCEQHSRLLISENFSYVNKHFLNILEQNSRKKINQVFVFTEWEKKREKIYLSTHHQIDNFKIFSLLRR